MNRLLIGTNKLPILDNLPVPFLLIDDGPLIDAVSIPKRRTVTHFDVAEHSFNPLKNIDYLRARHFVDVINAIFPEGENTLTKRSAAYHLLGALLIDKPQRLAQLFPRASGKEAPGLVDARQKIDTLLLSRVLARVLSSPLNFSLDGIILARLPRAELGDFDCFVLANLLVSLYKGQVVIPDFGFYSCSFHVSLIRQNRLIAGVNYLDETPLKNELLMIDGKIPSHCLPEDAEVLAQYAGKAPNTNAYADFIERSIR